MLFALPFHVQSNYVLIKRALFLNGIHECFHNPRDRWPTEPKNSVAFLTGLFICQGRLSKGNRCYGNILELKVFSLFKRISMMIRDQDRKKPEISQLIKTANCLDFFKVSIQEKLFGVDLYCYSILHEDNTLWGLKPALSFFNWREKFWNSSRNKNTCIWFLRNFDYRLAIWSLAISPAFPNFLRFSSSFSYSHIVLELLLSSNYWRFFTSQSYIFWEFL